MPLIQGVPTVKPKEIGNTGVLVSELALGTWQYHGGAETLRAGIELGAFFIDTAESYGSEPIVGEAIQGIRNRVFLASKVSPRHFRYRDVIKAAECSLKQMNTDYLDLYQLHWPNYTIGIAETVSAMERLVEMGKIRFIGVSNFSVSELQQAQAKLSKCRIVSNQVRYSLLDRSPESGMLAFCKSNRISLLAFSPLGTGFAGIRAADPDDVLGKISAETGKTRVQVALNWCLSPSPVIAIFKSENIEHVREDCAASGWRLTADQHQKVSQGIAAYRHRGRPEQFARRLARRALQYAGRNLGAPTNADRY
jgi:diketogulonate reductase-like aldo/keto reductase